MKYKTYKKRPTKYQLKKSNKSLSILFALAIGAGIINGIFFNGEITEIKESVIAQSAEIKEIKEDMSVVKAVPLISQNFQAEIDIRQAAEQACKYINADQWGLQEQCEKDLLGIAYTEVRNFDCLKVGDGGKSFGCFQIHLGYHPDITVEQAQDPYFAATWTAKRLVAKGYPKYRSSAVMSHNGTPGTSKTLAYLKTVNSIALK